MNEHETQRIAMALNALRPDWPTRQLTTLLAHPALTDRPRRDVVVALSWIACESGTHNPYRVLEAGPWWKAAAVDGASSHRDNPPRHLRCSVCSLSKDRCEQVWPDHDFEPVADRKLPPEQIQAVVTELKGHLEPMKTPAQPREAAHGERAERTNTDGIAATHRHFNGSCTGCDWQSTDLTLSLRVDHAAHVAELVEAHGQRTQATDTDTEEHEDA